jgi:transcriptional regulator with XRE-family HTH domain
MIFRNFSAWLNKKLNAKGWTQLKLASEIGLGRTRVNDYFNGLAVPPMDRLVTIAIELDFSLDEFKELLELPELLQPTVKEDKYDYEQAVKLFQKHSHRKSA